jgi:type I restriction enzyme M protein
VVRLMIEMLDPREGETIYDPACGTGGMLLAAVQHVKERHGDVKRLWGKLFGQEKNLTTSSIARMNLFLHGIEDFQIVRGDTLRNPAFFEGDRLANFDCVIANPPFLSGESGARNCGSTIRSAATSPACRHRVAVTSPGCSTWSSQWPRSGRMAVVLPQGALFRKGAEGGIRQKLLEMDLVEASSAWHPTCSTAPASPPAFLVLRKKKPGQRRKKVMIADASRLFRRGRAQNYLEPEHALEIQGWFEKFEDVQDAVRIVSLDDIKAEDWTLNISRYVLPPLQEDIPPLPEAIAAFKDALTRCREAEDRLAKVMTEGGWLQ